MQAQNPVLLGLLMALAWLHRVGLTSKPRLFGREHCFCENSLRVNQEGDLPQAPNGKSDAFPTEKYSNQKRLAALNILISRKLRSTEFSVVVGD
jgi:hypothetical protein